MPGLRIPVKVRFDPAEEADPEPTRTRQEEDSRRMKITDSILEKYGYTKGCVGCDFKKWGLKEARPHTEGCRRRIMEDMGKTDEGRSIWIERERETEDNEECPAKRSQNPRGRTKNKKTEGQGEKKPYKKTQWRMKKRSNKKTKIKDAGKEKKRKKSLRQKPKGEEPLRQRTSGQSEKMEEQLREEGDVGSPHARSKYRKERSEQPKIQGDVGSPHARSKCRK